MTGRSAIIRWLKCLVGKRFQGHDGKDPGEKNNLAESDPELAKDLQKRLRTWQESVLNSLQGADYRQKAQGE